jgi:hypothetical protein
VLTWRVQLLATHFCDKAKDSRYYELVEETIREGFEYKYFTIEEEHREVIAIQLFFLLDQDLAASRLAF